MDQQIGTNSWLCSVTCFGGCLVGCAAGCAVEGPVPISDVIGATAVNATATTVSTGATKSAL
ncbi:hypothetical protein [Paenibacillus polysaccharolyticus]|uniref:hypothetical protein n=1 Tax=Paenibacillus polysaccharolyticus TaxID=582692 RepID=UPI00280B45F0|nr:hypothetical protein [Paenibacillus polysaccharolyticus]